MESIGIIEMLEWYIVGFSVTLGSLHLISKLNLLKRREKKTKYVESSYEIGISGT
ncbi:MAG TPA: hypothetical protein VI146_04625 [Nitrososphaeraceae archaeon]|nr:hypothetical protein [Nitrososphaeraceae archaeon]